VSKLDYRQTYPNLIKSLKKQYSRDEAMKMAVGTSTVFKAFGILEREVLIQYGLRNNDYVIDVGCGSGRLAMPLSEFLSGRYLGIDIVPELIDYAQSTVGRSDWSFKVTEGLTIPERDNKADFICFFSVFTHLLHEESYVYLQEAKRVLKPTGKIVFSFLDFSVPAHWAIFEDNIATIGKSNPLNQFISRDAIQVWASRLGLKIEDFHDGDKPHIKLSCPIILGDGKEVTDMGNLGQSICILSST